MKIILCTMLALLLVQVQAVNAKGISFKAHGPKVEMIPFSEATGSTKAFAFQTFAGQTIRLGQLKNVHAKKAKAINKVIKDGLLELKSGDIFYESELKFVITPSGEFTGGSSLIVGNPLGRSPHTPK